jgi:tetratricopeptide (TPR) repeat protein
MARPSGSKAATRRGAIYADLLQAVEHHKAGRLDAAEALYRRVLRFAPSQPDALHYLGVATMDRGQYDAAIDLIERALKLGPDNASVRCNLGNALKASGRRTDAATQYRAATVLEPRFTLAHCNLGTLLNDMGDHAQALASFGRAVKLDGNLPEAHAGRGFALRRLGRGAEAEAALRRALALRPKWAGAWSDLGLVLSELDRFDDALASHRRAIELEPNAATYRFALAQTLYRAGDATGAAASLRQAVGLDPANAIAWNELGRVMRALGRFDEAQTCLQRALQIDPNFADAHRNLALIGVHSESSDEIERLTALLRSGQISAMDRVTAGFALGKLLDDSGAYDQAFASYAAANLLYRDMKAVVGERFDAAALRHEVNQIIAEWTGDAAAVEPCRSVLPVFIVGMPRSGTSLVEQIAASHSQVFGAGELREIGRIAGARLTEGWQAVTSLAASHLDRLRERGGGALRVIDKMPDNIFHAGLIATLYPGARLIFCTRDPRDTALSCFFQFFPVGMLFSYDLADCGARQEQTDRLAAHWRRVLPLPMLEVNYEALVADLAGESRRLIDFLGLEWEENCLTFNQTDRPVMTASSWQVRQPLYRHAVGRWRHYRAHLNDLMAVLDNW